MDSVGRGGVYDVMRDAWIMRGHYAVAEARELRIEARALRTDARSTRCRFVVAQTHKLRAEARDLRAEARSTRLIAQAARDGLITEALDVTPVAGTTGLRERSDNPAGPSVRSPAAA